MSATGKTFDVLVIGGGPAGTSAAITCARAGLSVALLEAKPFPREAPGETLHPGVEPLLTRLGAGVDLARANSLRHEGVWVTGLGNTEFRPYGSDRDGPWLGYQAIRSEFDSMLLAKARACGVNILQPHRALRVLRTGDRAAGAETTAGTLIARHTIDASGTSTWLARQLSLPHRRVSRKLIATYGYVRGECPVRDAAPCFTYRPDGWEWTARIQPGLYHWTRLSTTSPALRDVKPPAELAGLESVGRPKGRDVTWRRLDACAGPGYYIAGDAATVSDPSSSHGVLRALMSGMLAGHMVINSTLTGEPETALTAEYRQFLHTTFEFDWSQISRQPHFA